MSEYAVFIHPNAEVHHTVLLGHGTKVWSGAVIFEGTQIGMHCTIGANCFLGAHCTIGDYTVFQTGAQIPSDTHIGSYVLLGPGAVLTDCARPNLRDKTQEVHRAPCVEDDVTIGANASIQAGVVIGEGACVGMGAVVTHDVPPGRTVVGNPARLVLASAWLDQAAQAQAPSEKAS